MGWSSMTWFANFFIITLNSSNHYIQVGGMPTRFKYRTSAPQSYGLSIEEILMADDKDLNQYMGIKKYAPYRKSGTWDNQRPERLKDLKQKLGERISQSKENDDIRSIKKRKGKKERQKLKATAAVEGSSTFGGTEGEKKEESLKKRKREDEVAGTRVESIQDEEAARATKKRKRRHKKAALIG
jgi:protein KRI1